MALSAATLRKIRAVRIQIAASVDATTSALVVAWGNAWEEIAAEWADAIDDLLTLGDGEWPRRAQIRRATRATNALKVTAGHLTDLSKRAGVSISTDLQRLVSAAASWEGGIVTAQLPSGFVLTWTEVDPSALEAIVKRSTGQIESLTRPLPREQRAVMKQALIRGVAVGDNPKAAARLMLKRLQGGFLGGATRAQTIARTEMLDAYRASALQSRLANADTLQGWRWIADKSSRTCPACLAMDGSVHPLDEAGPLGHPNCRCSAAPVSKTWRDLGIDLDEPADVYQSGRDWFAQQSPTTQAEIMGRDRLAALNAGRLTWDRIPQTRSADGWRDSIVVRPLAA